MASPKGSIFIKHSDGRGFYLYTNKDGDKLPKILRDALVRGKERWGDTPTLTRIIFSEMIQRDVFGTNSFAISNSLMDNENLILVVDDTNERVGIFGENGRKIRELTYQNYCNLSNPTWANICNSRYEDGYGVNRRRADPYQF